MHRHLVTEASQILDIANYYWNACTLHAAVKLGLFTALGNRARTSAGLAADLECNEEALELLLNALTAMGLLVKENDRYANTEAASQYLVGGSDQYLGDIILHHHHVVDGWNRLDEAVKHGGPVEMRSFGEEEERRRFLLGMQNLARLNGPRLIKHVDLDGRKRLLDLGGGPGTYSLFFCLANPQLEGTIFDRPTTEPYARPVLEHPKIGGRIRFVAGDFLTDPLEGSFDVIWISHVLHSQSPTTCRELLQKVVRVLEPGGMLLVHEFFLNDTKAGPLFPALFSLNMLINNGRGRSYSAGEITAMLEECGLTNIRRLPYQGPNDGYVLRGDKP